MACGHEKNPSNSNSKILISQNSNYQRENGISEKGIGTLE